MSQPIQAVVVWAGGVLLPGLQELMTGVMAEEAGVEINWPELRARNERTEKWLLGQMSDEAYLGEILGDSKAALTPARFIEAARAMLKVNGALLDTLVELPEAYRRFLLLDYPAAWLDEATHSALARYCPPSQQIKLYEANLSRLIPDGLHLAAVEASAPLLECLFIDSDLKRSIQTVRAGASVETYLSPRRMRRGFILRRLLPVELPSHVPGHN